MSGRKVRGAGQCPRCGCRKVGRVKQPVTEFYARTLEVCGNCAAAWEPFDAAKLLDADMPRTSCFTEPCDNCAFRPGSNEQRDPELWRELMAKLKAGGRFYCHKGIPINPGGEDGFAYPRGRDGEPVARKLRLCRGFLDMVGKRWDKEFAT